jgi:modification methylase
MSDRLIHWLRWPVDEPAVPSVWPTGADSLDVQLADCGYHHATHSDPAVMAPAIAEYAITVLTRRGDVVLDPDCGAGTTLVEALRAGRHAIGLTADRRWWHPARSNVTAIKAGGAPGEGMVLIRRPTTLAAAETAGFTGRVALLLTTFRSHGSLPAGLDRFRTLLSACRPLLRPGGHVVITCAPQRHPTRHDLLDVPGQLLALASTAGLAPIGRCVALTAAVRGHRVHTHATLAQWRTVARIEHATGHPVALPAHHTAVVLRADPDATDAALTRPIPPLPEPPSYRRSSRPAGACRERDRRCLTSAIAERAA